MPSPPFPQLLRSRAQQIRHDADFGHAFAPGLRMRVPHEHGAYYVVTNAQGFREDHDLHAPRAGFRVLCVGDSYAAGDGVDNAERFSAQLGARLGVTVTNIAVPGYGPDQNVLQLERASLPRADLILWCVAVHTIERIQSSRRIAIDRDGRLLSLARPHFVLTPTGALELRGVPVVAAGESLPDDPVRPIGSPMAVWCTDVLRRLRARVVSQLTPWLKPEPDPEYRDRDSPQWRLMAAIVQRFHAAAGGVPVAVVPLPTTRYVTETLTPHYLQRFGELAKPAAGLHVLDVLGGLRRCPRAEARGFHYRLDGHFTRTGHAAVADALAAELLRSQLVPADRGRATTGSLAAAMRDGSCGRRLVLHVGWTLDDGHAQLRDGESLGTLHRERLLVGHASRPGVLPLSAVNAALEDAGVAGPELTEIVLCAPASVAGLVGRPLGGPTAFPFASGLVRWFGAAARDLRRFLAFTGGIREQFGDADVAVGAEPLHQVGVEPRDDEIGWLLHRLARVPQRLAVDALTRRLRRLGRRWELATRDAREAVLPTTAPLRRGRAAARLARRAGG